MPSCPKCHSRRLSLLYSSWNRARLVCRCGWIGVRFDTTAPAVRSQIERLPITTKLPPQDAVFLLRGGNR